MAQGGRKQRPMGAGGDPVFSQFPIYELCLNNILVTSSHITYTMISNIYFVSHAREPRTDVAGN